MRARPLVDVHVAAEPARVLERFTESLAGGSCPCVGHVGRMELSLTVGRERKHLWSPWISLEVRASETGSWVRGRFGPHPELWTAFVALYSALVFAVLMGTLFGYGQHLVGEDPLGLRIAAGAAVGLVLACSVDLVGRRVGAAQMGVIRTFIHEVLTEADMAAR